MRKFLFVALVAAALVGCKKKDTVEAKDADGTEMSTETGKTVAADAAASYVWWQGSKKVGGGKHNGKFPIKEGNFELKDGNLVGGNFTIDVAGMTNEDLEGEMQGKLLGHLKSDDFFDVENHPTASFKILGSKALENDADGNTHQVSGTLTLKNTSKVIDIPAKVSLNGENVTFESSFNIDRTDFNMEYGSETKIADIAADNVINDAVEIKVMAKS